MARSQHRPRTSKPGRGSASYRAFRDAIKHMSETEDLLPLALDSLITIAASTH